MNLKCIAWLSFQLLCFISYSQWEKPREAFFQHLKNYQFEEARELIADVPDPSWIQAMTLLHDVLYESGQLGEAKVKQDSINIYQLEHTFPDSSGKVITQLLWGYYHFYDNPYTSLPIERFSEAYLVARQMGTPEEIKFCVYSILQLYNWELSQSNDDILEYLNVFKELIEDKADEFHYNMFKFQYELRKINPKEVDVSERFVATFKTLMNSFEQDHHFWIEYPIALAIYKRYYGTEFNVEEPLQEAQALLRQALDKMGDEPYLRYLKFRVYIQLSELAKARRDYTQALNYISEARKNSYLNDPVRADFWINRYAASSLFGNGEVDSAYYALSRADTLRNQLDYLLNALQISQFKWKFQTEEKEKQLLLEKEAKSQSRNIALSLGLVLILGIAISILIYRDSKRKELLAIQDKNIHAQKVNSLLKEQELVVLNAMIEVQEKERKRIAEDLHDRLGSTLSAVKMHLDVMAEDQPHYAKINSMVDQAVNDTREIAHDMLSGVLTKFGLKAALRDLKETIESANHFTINLNIIEFDERLATETEIHIYRILQELLSNTLKHAHASEVVIELKKANTKELVITYTDDGLGFDPEQQSNGMGLRNIESRINKINGSHFISSAQNQGVQVVIKVKV